MTRQARQVWLLVALLATFGVVVWYQTLPEGTAAGAATPSNPRSGPAREPARIAVADVALERLQAGEDRFTAPRRDPFRFRPKPPPPVQAPPPVAFVPPPVQPQTPPPRPITLKYLGFVELPSGGRMAWLNDNSGRTPMNGRQGDVIDGQYRLLRVDPQEIEIAYLDGTGRRRIPKTGQ